MRPLFTFFFTLALVGTMLTYDEIASADEYSDGMKSFKAGNNAEALEFFIANLTSNPKHQKSVDMVKELLPKVVEQRKASAKRYEESGEWDKAQKEYDRLTRLDKVLQGLVAFDNGMQTTFERFDATVQQNEATRNAAEQYYQRGIEAMQIPGNAAAAAAFFKEARKFDPDYKDAKLLSAQALYNDGITLIDRRDFKGGVKLLWNIRDFYPDGFNDSEIRVNDAIDSAKTRIAIMPFEDLTFKTQFGDIGSGMSSEIIAAGVNSAPVFVDFVDRDYVYSVLSEQDFALGDRVDPSTAPKIGKMAGVHVFVFGKITGVTPVYPRVVEQRGESRSTLYRNKQQIPLYARWVKHRREGEVTVTATYQVLDVATGRIIDSKSISRKSSSVAQWVTFVGDEDAIEPSVKAYSTTGDVSVEPAELLANRTVGLISREIAGHLLTANGN